MTDQDQSPRSLEKSLARKQRKHQTMLARVEKAAARYERRKAKLLALEARLADLERRIADPRKGPGHNGAGKSLRPAQLIFNPSSGRDERNNAMRLAHVVSALRTHGIEATIGVKTSGKAARELARDAKRARVPLVIVAGGDGTIEDVASQLIGSSTAIGIVPLGTMNNLARCLGVPLDIDEACALIGIGAMRHIDMGRVFSNDRPQVEYFLEGAGAGLSALAALAGQGLEKRRWHLIPEVLRRFFESKPGTIRVTIDDTTIEAATHIVTVSNAPMMGNNLLVAPDAKMDDGWLDVVVYDGMRDAPLVKHFMAAGGDTPERIPSYRARHVRITASEPLPANSDKDYTPKRRMIEIEVVPRALTVIAGNGIGLTVPVEAAATVSTPIPGDAETNGDNVAAQRNGKPEPQPEPAPVHDASRV